MQGQGIQDTLNTLFCIWLLHLAHISKGVSLERCWNKSTILLQQTDVGDPPAKPCNAWSLQLIISLSTRSYVHCPPKSCIEVAILAMAWTWIHMPRKKVGWRAQLADKQQFIFRALCKARHVCHRTKGWGSKGLV